MTTLTLSVAGLVLVLGGLGYWLIMHQAAKRRAERDVFHHFYCPNCRRRLRFQAHQTGRSGACSHCRRPLVFPPVSQAVE